MSYYADDIRRIAKQKENKQGLGDAEVRPSVDGSTKPMVDVDQGPEPTGGYVSPLTEQSRTVQTVKVYNPADPTEWIDVDQATQIIFEDADQTELIMDLIP